MGQKSNPTSFQQEQRKPPSWASNSNVEYFLLTKELLELERSVSSFFEKNNSIVHEMLVYRLKENKKIFVYLSFFPLGRKKRVNPGINRIKAKTFATSFFSLLKAKNCTFSKRVVLQNIEKSVARKVEIKAFRKKSTVLFSEFRRESFYSSGLSLFFLVSFLRNSSIVLSKFIAKYFKILHRNKKINKFLNFLAVFVSSIVTKNVSKKGLKGIKIQIKGRFAGAPRSKKRVFEKGKIPLQTVCSKINYAMTHVYTSYGVFSVKVWVSS